MPKNFTEKEIREIINSHPNLTDADRDRLAEDLGIILEPRKVEVTTYLFKEYGSKNAVVFCNSALGISDGFGYTNILKHVQKGFGEFGWGGTKVKVTIEEVLD